MSFKGMKGVQGTVGKRRETLLDKIKFLIEYEEAYKKNYEIEIKDYEYYIYEKNATLYIDQYKKEQKNLDCTNRRLNSLKNLIINDKYNILDKLFMYAHDEHKIQKCLEFSNEVLDGLINIELNSETSLYEINYKGTTIYIYETDIITLKTIHEQLKREKYLKDKLGLKEENIILKE